MGTEVVKWCRRCPNFATQSTDPSNVDSNGEPNPDQKIFSSQQGIRQLSVSNPIQPVNLLSVKQQLREKLQIISLHAVHNKLYQSELPSGISTDKSQKLLQSSMMMGKKQFYPSNFHTPQGEEREKEERRSFLQSKVKENERMKKLVLTPTKQYPTKKISAYLHARNEIMRQLYENFVYQLYFDAVIPKKGIHYFQMRVTDRVEDEKIAKKKQKEYFKIGIKQNYSINENKRQNSKKLDLIHMEINQGIEQCSFCILHTSTEKMIYNLKIEVSKELRYVKLFMNQQQIQTKQLSKEMVNKEIVPFIETKHIQIDFQLI